MSQYTEFTVRPTRTEDPIFGVRTPGDTDIASRDELARGLNPLHHIPFVSQVYEAATGDSGPAVAKLIGGAILGGPIGFVASLANVIFEQEAGQSIVTAMVDAVGGSTAEHAPVQVASTSKAAQTYQQAAATTEPKEIAASAIEILPPEPKQTAATTTARDVAENMKLASATVPTDDPVLSLFGGQTASAHRSYQKAQLLPYLRDVTHSQML